MSTFKQNITMNGTAAAQVTIPTGMKYICVYNNTDNTIQLYDDIRTVNDADQRDVMVTCAPYTAITVPLNTSATVLTVIYLNGGGTGFKVAQLMVDTENLNINTQMGNPGTNQNIFIQGDAVGLAKAAQLPAALTGLGNLKVEVLNEVPVSVAGEVEINNDTGNPIPITAAQLDTMITLLTDLNAKQDTANGYLATIATNTTPAP